MVAGTEQHFADLNRAWPDLDGVDGVGYTICPQVHAADDTSLMENSWVKLTQCSPPALGRVADRCTSSPWR